MTVANFGCNRIRLGFVTRVGIKIIRRELVTNQTDIPVARITNQTESKYCARFDTKKKARLQ
jgi:hypothetical protein